MNWRDYLNRIIAPEIKLLAAILFVCLLISTTGVPFVWLFVLALLAFSGFHIYQSKRLLAWLVKKKLPSPPDDLRGIWYQIAMEIHRRNKLTRAADISQKQQIAQFQKVSTALPDGIVIIDEMSRIEWLNSRAESLLGLVRQRDLGSNIINLLRDPAFVNYYHQVDEKAHLRLNSPSNRDIKLDIRLVPYNQKHLLIVQDYTRLHQMEQVRQDFVANVSHELRTPITVLVGYLETLDSDDSEALQPYQPVVSQMKQQSQRMMALVEDLLILSNLENNRTKHYQAEVAVPSLLQTLIEEARLLGSETLQMTLEVEPTLWLKGNSKQLHSAFLNLMSNAVHYTPDDGQIWVRWYATDTALIMEVEDNGAGIEPQHIGRLTERFYRADRGRSREDGGTGLGLSIVKHALQLHDARLVILSEIGMGSTFRCLFPIERGLDRSSINNP